MTWKQILNIDEIAQIDTIESLNKTPSWNKREFSIECCLGLERVRLPCGKQHHLDGIILCVYGLCYKFGFDTYDAYLYVKSNGEQWLTIYNEKEIDHFDIKKVSTKGKMWII